MLVFLFEPGPSHFPEQGLVIMLFRKGWITAGAPDSAWANVFHHCRFKLIHKFLLFFICFYNNTLGPVFVSSEMASKGQDGWTTSIVGALT